MTILSRGYLYQWRRREGYTERSGSGVQGVLEVMEGERDGG